MGAWQALFDDAGANDLVRHDGSLYIFEAHERQSAIDMLAYHQGFEVPMRLVQGPELRAMEPALNARAALALELPQVSRTLDPFALSQRLLRCFIERGGVFRRDELQGVERSAQDGERVLARLGSGEQLPAERLVLCSGAWSRRLAQSLGDEIPLDTERGYHVLFDQAGGLLSRPVCWGAGGFYLTPMAQGLRVAGTVEFLSLIHI